MLWLETFPQLQQCPEPGDWLDVLLAGHSQARLQHGPAQNFERVNIPPSQPETLSAAVLQAEDKKLIQEAFAFLITQHKKSTPRLQAMLALHDRVLQEDIAEMILSYCLQWEPPETVWERGGGFLQQHPASLGLRLPLALLATGQQQPEKIRDLLDEAIIWSDFVQRYPQLPVNVQNIRIFHTMTCLYFARRQQLFEAVWAWLICAEAQAAGPERQTLAREIVRSCQQPEQLIALKSWLQVAG
ncbi:MAG: hypothetical protein IGS03_17195 [Candidatus Sericytochromatia bacterium]|nr:hypothetical protein [Candidatus Sericytochromatia bacterium]